MIAFDRDASQSECGGLKRLRLRCAVHEMCRGAPGITRKRREAPHPIYSGHRFTRGQLSVRGCFKCGDAVSALHLIQGFRILLQLDDRVFGRRRRGVGTMGAGHTQRLMLLARLVVSANRRGYFPGNQGRVSHGLGAELRGAGPVGSAVPVFNSCPFTGHLGKPRCPVESVQCAREQPLLFF